MTFLRTLGLLAIAASTLAQTALASPHWSSTDGQAALFNSKDDSKCKTGKRYPFHLYAANESRPITLYEGQLWVGTLDARPTQWFLEKWEGEDEWGVLTINPSGRAMYWSYLSPYDEITVGPENARLPYYIRTGEKDGKKWPRIAIYKKDEDRCLAFKREGAIKMPRFTECGDILLKEAHPWEWETSEDGCADIPGESTHHVGL